MTRARRPVIASRNLPQPARSTELVGVRNYSDTMADMFCAYLRTRHRA